jgi:hypothetical protein
MKNILKISLLSFGVLFIGSVAKAQDIKKDAATTSGQLEAPSSDSRTAPQSGTTTAKDTKSDKQEPVKTAPKDSKTAKSDTTQPGGTRMAITEQGMPKKKNKAKSAAATTTTTNAPPAEKATPKK